MPQPQQPQQSHPQQPKNETLEFLKREEVRTMAKDIALLREEEAKKERDRITELKAEELAQSSKAAAEHAKEERPKPPLMPHAQEQKPVFVRARTRSEKILIRAIVAGVLLFILLNGLAFGYWYFTRKRGGETTPGPQSSPEARVGEAESGNGNQVSGGNLVSPTPIVFFEALQQKTIDLGSTHALLLVLSDALKEEYAQGFTRIFIKKAEDAAFVTTTEFLKKTTIAMPEPLLSLLKEDFMLFVYALPGRKRLGFIGELSQAEAAQDIVRSWETTLEQDTKPLWEIVGQKGSAYTPFFRQTVYQDNVVRFQTFSALDFGLVYTLSGARIILATSLESVTEAVDQMTQSR